VCRQRRRFLRQNASLALRQAASAALEGDPAAIEKLKDTPDYCTE
jgi:hypothetical protein